MSRSAFACDSPLHEGNRYEGADGKVIGAFERYARRIEMRRLDGMDREVETIGYLCRTCAHLEMECLRHGEPVDQERLL